MRGGVQLSLKGMPQILDGNRVRGQIVGELLPRVQALAARGVPPGLAVILAGHNPASEIYVRGKIKACRELGIYSESLTPPDIVTTEELLAAVERLNARRDIHGILLQLPLPPQVDLGSAAAPAMNSRLFAGAVANFRDDGRYQRHADWENAASDEVVEETALAGLESSQDSDADFALDYRCTRACDRAGKSGDLVARGYFGSQVQDVL
jgi:hypothetical protein